jgi:hypothetical protein
MGAADAMDSMDRRDRSVFAVPPSGHSSPSSQSSPFNGAWAGRVLLVLKVFRFPPSSLSSAAMVAGRKRGGGEDIEDKQSNASEDYEDGEDAPQ